MDPSFSSLTEQLATKFRSLIAMTPVAAEDVPEDTPRAGIYLFSEHGVHMYAGRTKRKLCVRIRNHFSAARDCPFAWLLAREITGFRPTYRREGSRADLLTRPDFARIYEEQKKRIRRMDVRFVEESDPLRQTLLEIYAAVVSRAKYNNFNCH
jgi:hypothetical protein